jgi:hypothetical protein
MAVIPPYTAINWDSSTTPLNPTNLNKMDGQIKSLSDQAVSGGGYYLEIALVTFGASGSTSSITASGTFGNTYANPPFVAPMSFTQQQSYVDTMTFPSITTTRTGFTATIKVADRNNTSNNFGAGNIIMAFLVVGK